MSDAPTLPTPIADWEATGLREAMTAGHVALWTWDPSRDRLRLTGPARALGLGPLGQECGSAALRALVHPQDVEIVDGFLRRRSVSGANVTLLPR